MLYLRSVGEVSRQDIVDAFDLSVEDQEQLDRLITYYQGLSVEDKIRFGDRLHSGVICLQAGLITKAKLRDLLALNDPPAVRTLWSRVRNLFP
jgi:hypothetical protein